jgi:hypothetical protein
MGEAGPRGFQETAHYCKNPDRRDGRSATDWEMHGSRRLRGRGRRRDGVSDRGNAWHSALSGQPAAGAQRQPGLAKRLCFLRGGAAMDRHAAAARSPLPCLFRQRQRNRDATHRGRGRTHHRALRAPIRIGADARGIALGFARQAGRSHALSAPHDGRSAGRGGVRPRSQAGRAAAAARRHRSAAGTIGLGAVARGVRRRDCRRSLCRSARTDHRRAPAARPLQRDRHTRAGCEQATVEVSAASSTISMPRWRAISRSMPWPKGRG